ncbi:MAG: RAMP superfamily CRISPR-associated protein [Thermoplasmata archaeon]
MKLEIKIKTPTVVTSGDNLYLADIFQKDGIYYRVRAEDLIYSMLEDSGNIEKLNDILQKYKEYLFNPTNAQSLFKDIKIDDKLILPRIDDYPKSDRIREILDYTGYFREINNRYYFLPYIPGSTIKGLLRTALIHYIWKNFKNDGKIENAENKINFYHPKTKNKQLTDIFRFIHVSDFHVEVDDYSKISLGIGKVIRIRQNKQYNGKRNYTFYYPQGMKFVGEIKIQKDLEIYLNKLKKNPFDYSKFKENAIMEEMIIKNFENDRLNSKAIIIFLLNKLKEYTVDVVKSYQYSFLFKEYDVEISDDDNIYDAYIGRFKGKYLNVPVLPQKIETFPIIIAKNKMWKMGHITIEIKGED